MCSGRFSKPAPAGQKGRRACGVASPKYATHSHLRERLAIFYSTGPYSTQQHPPFIRNPEPQLDKRGRRAPTVPPRDWDSEAEPNIRNRTTTIETETRR